MKKALHFVSPSLRELFFLALCVCLIAIGGVFLAASHTQAFLNQPLTGYAWGASYLSGGSGDTGGIGWISFNCTNDGSCTSSPYSVNLLNGDLIGYAWSSNYGWIKFGGLSDFPTGGGTSAENARVSGNNIVGWARVCSGTVNGDCTGASRSDFDGWISLSGTGYGLVINGNGFTSTSYAWGGPDMGWITFDAQVGGGNGCAYKVCIGNPVTVDLLVKPLAGANAKYIEVTTGDTIEFSWTSENVPSGALCTTSSDNPLDQTWISTTRASASDPSAPISYTARGGTTVFSISCPSNNGSVAKDSVTVKGVSSGGSAVSAHLLVRNSDEAYVSGTVHLEYGSDLWLQWSSENAGSCVSLSSGFSTDEATNNLGAQFGTVDSTQTYYLKCTNADDTASDIDAVTVIADNAPTTGGCADPAGRSDLAEGESRDFAKAPQARTCLWQSRTCEVSGEVLALSGDSDYVFATCNGDPRTKEI